MDESKVNLTELTIEINEGRGCGPLKDHILLHLEHLGPKLPTLVLLHGFPSFSREFDTLIPLLATHYHLIAPDFPGFGQSDAPPPSSYTYTFDHLAKTIDDLLEKLKINKCGLLPS
jgi:pimeloyl-ACP methyl ester carboxylesterase